MVWTPLKNMKVNSIGMMTFPIIYGKMPNWWQPNQQPDGLNAPRWSQPPTSPVSVARGMPLKVPVARSKCLGEPKRDFTMASHGGFTRGSSKWIVYNGTSCGKSYENWYKIHNGDGFFHEKKWWLNWWNQQTPFIQHALIISFPIMVHYGW